MKADMNERGVMTLTPETPTEAYALRQWVNQAWVQQKDEMRREDGHWRGSMMIVSTQVPNVELTGGASAPSSDRRERG